MPTATAQVQSIDEVSNLPKITSFEFVASKNPGMIILRDHLSDGKSRDTELKREVVIESVSHCISPPLAIDLLPAPEEAVAPPVVVASVDKLPKVTFMSGPSGLPALSAGRKVEMQLREDGATVVRFLDSAALSTESEKCVRPFPESNDADAGPEFHWGLSYLIEYNEDDTMKMAPYADKKFGYNYAEHAMVGNSLTLSFPSGNVPAGDKVFTLQNGVSLTYGQINGFSGDYYGTKDPICKGSSQEDQCQRFVRAFNNLAKNPGTKAEIANLMVNRNKEYEAIKKAREEGRSTFQAYKTTAIPWGDDASSELYTAWRSSTGEFASLPYLQLTAMNFDHFGADALIAYSAGHYCALQEAAHGNLELAYTMNAFADHFLEDSFAAGHIRTPRRAIHSDWYPAGDLCSKYMHDEDNFLGLLVSNIRGDHWKAFGDKKLFEPENEKNYALLREALQISIDEVYKAYVSHVAEKDATKYGITKLVPRTLDPGNGVPLFVAQDGNVYIRTNVWSGPPFNKKYINNGAHVLIPDLYPWAGILLSLASDKDFEKY